MTHRTLKSSDGEGFLRAAWDSWFDLVVERKGQLSLIVAPTVRKGVWSFRLTYRSPLDALAAFPTASVTAEYPTAQVQTVEAFLYQLVVKMERMLDSQDRYPGGRG